MDSNPILMFLFRASSQWRQWKFCPRTSDLCER